MSPRASSRESSAQLLGSSAVGRGRCYRHPAGCWQRRRKAAGWAASDASSQRRRSDSVEPLLKAARAVASPERSWVPKRKLSSAPPAAVPARRDAAPAAAEAVRQRAAAAARAAAPLPHSPPRSALAAPRTAPLARLTAAAAVALWAWRDTRGSSHASPALSARSRAADEAEENDILTS